MEEKPEGTPNPLNPNLEKTPLDANPSEPMEPVEVPVKIGSAKPEAPVKPVQAVDPMIPVRPMGPVEPVIEKPPAEQIDVVEESFSAEPTTEILVEHEEKPEIVAEPETPVTPEVPIAPEPAPVPDPLATLGVVTNMDGTPAENLDPTNRPMQKAPVQTPPTPRKNKKRTALIIGIIVSLILAIACGVAALVITLSADKTDHVATAVDKILSGNAPTNVMMDGEINVKVNDVRSVISDFKITIGTEAVTSSLINSTVAALNVNLRDGGSFSFKVSEVYAANGDLYFKVDGMAEASSMITQPKDIEALKAFTELLDAFKAVDGEWIRVPVDELGSILPESVVDENMVSCATDLVNDISSNHNTVSSLYSKYPFIVSTNESVEIASEKDPIYRVLIDEDNFNSFASEAKNLNVMKSLSSCLDYDNNPANLDNALKAIQDSTKIFAEVDENYNFSRVYLESDVNNDAAEMIVDLRFTYPANVNIPEPVEYKNLSEVLQNLTLNLTSSPSSDIIEPSAN